MSLDTLTLNGTSLSDTTVFGLEAIDFTPPAKKPEWAQSADADGSLLVRTPLFDNRTITANIRIVPQATMDLALEKLGILVDLLQEAEKQPEGIQLVWSPATATKKITFYVLTGAVTGIPMVNEGQGVGWYAKSPLVTVALTCKPFGYGTEVKVAEGESIEKLSIAILSIPPPEVAGDVPAEGRLVVKDTAAVGRRFVEWGLENRYYNGSQGLVLDSEFMTPVSGAYSTALNASGAYLPVGHTKGTIATTLLPEATVCCNTAPREHVGMFRVKARVQVVLGSESLAANVHLRLSYQDGNGPFRANAWQTPVLGGSFVEVDLGVITTSQALIGSQKWLGQVEAYSENPTGKDTLHIDYLTIIPAAEGYGKARGALSSAPGTLAAFDNFTTGTLSGNLNARTPGLGAAWATSGAPTDFTVTAGAATRATKSDAEPRYAVLGAAQGNAKATLTYTTASWPLSGLLYTAIVGRWVDANNYAYCLLIRGLGGVAVELGVKVAGEFLPTMKAVLLQKWSGPVISTGTLTALLDGSLSAAGTIEIGGSTLPFALSMSSSDIAAGGILASGKFGLYDQSTSGSAISRSYGNVSVTQIAAIPYCIQPSKAMEARSDSTLTTDSTGAYHGSVPEYRGSRFYVPQSGEAERTSRILVKADRNDLEESDQRTIADAFTVQVFVTPRYHVIPR